MTKYLILFFTCCLCFTNVSAQKKYALIGKVIDSQTREDLPAATVYLQELKSGTVTDMKGKFRLPPVKAAVYNVQVSFLGYTTKTIVCDQKNLAAGNLLIELEPSSIGLDDVVINGDSDGQVKAMLIQKKSENIKNIVSYEQIEQFPDMNSAEVVQRIPGITLKRDQGEGRYVQLRGTPPELTSFNVNGEQIPSPEGDVRYVGLDIISADQIESIEVTKVLTPDMDADGIGGSVNIITKSAKTEKPEIKATIANGYNNLMNTFNNPIVQANYSQRLGKVGVSANGSYYLNHQGSESMEYKYDKQPFWGSTDDGSDNYHLQYREAQLKHYTTTRERIGASGNVDYNFNEKSKIYFRAMFNQFTDEQSRKRKIYELDDAINEYYYLYGGVTHDIKERTKIQNISTFNLGGDHDLSFMKIDYEVSYGIATEDQPDRFEGEFNNPGQALKIKFDMSDPDWPNIYFPEEQDSEIANDYENYEFEEVLFKSSYIQDQNLTGKVNFTIPYKISPWNTGKIKFGAKARVKEKEREVDAVILTNFSSTGYPRGDYAEIPEVRLGDVHSDFYNGNLLGHGYVLEYMPGRDEFMSYYGDYENYFYKSEKYVLPESEGLDYNANEKIYAAYGMVQHDFNKLMVLGGVRYEITYVDYWGKNVNLDNYPDNAVTDTNDARQHQFILPNLQLKYKVNDNFNIRSSLTYTYARPNFADVLPYVETDREEEKMGNSELIYPLSTNFDFLAERYFYDGGLISGGVFYKKIDDFIFYYKRFLNSDGTGGSRKRVTSAENGINAKVYGAELIYQNKLTFLPGFMKDFGVYTNYTYTTSDATIYKRRSGNDYGDYQDEVEHISLPGQAEHTANIALFYDSKKFYAKISANYHTAFLDDLGADKDLDEYYDAALHIDFNTYYNITEHWKVFLDVVNLTNAPLRYYLGEPSTILKQEYYSWNARVGIKLNF